jgi:hypothetical protein
MRKLWYKWKLHWATMRARKAKARWLATKETIVGPKEEKASGRFDPFKPRHSTVVREGEYCDALIVQRTYEKLLSPMQQIPTATATEKKS